MSLLEVDWSKIPAPHDDGGAAHLPGAALPSIALRATRGEMVDLSALAGRTVIYTYPMTGRPDTPLPQGWDMLPGARGCTPQSCAFRDHLSELLGLGVKRVFGLSTQDTPYQQEAAERLHLSFPLLSDAELCLQRALTLPVMEVEGMVLLKRLAMIVDDGVISHVIYPVFPPDENAAMVIDWLVANRR
ncbi:MAG: peroxiredoxin [Congregibacter sp.]